MPKPMPLALVLPFPLLAPDTIRVHDVLTAVVGCWFLCCTFPTEKSQIPQNKQFLQIQEEAGDLIQ